MPVNAISALGKHRKCVASSLRKWTLENGPCLFLKFFDSFDPKPWTLDHFRRCCAGKRRSVASRRDDLVATALLAAATNQIGIAVVVAAAAAGAIVGDGIGYTVGRRFGMPLLREYGRYIRLDEIDC
ncbi:hypothetical protein [Bradyrhizobium sp. NAS96.2]|uniref:hypothetical protein n=1 Tax=Bradyrhizobium sp. NAS96.2 TaxID=1680160 RepID=UPI001160F814|nr:hypothetical protein [Bradyrhizobium sp. NAS96.2]